MSVLRKSFGFLFAVLASILVLLSLLVVTPIYALLFATMGQKAVRSAHRLSRVWARYVLFCCGTQLKIQGSEHINPSETYVFISNHRSYLDIPVCALTAQNTFKFLAKEELGKVPLLGYIIRNLYITVRRKNPRDGVIALKKMEAELAKGISVWIYPEGSRNNTDAPLTDFHDGAFTVAVNTGRPLAVLTIVDTGKLLPVGSLLYLMPGRVIASWTNLVPTQGLTRKDIPVLKEQVKRMMTAQIEKTKQMV